MLLELPGSPSLTYCTDIHAGRTMPETRTNLVSAGQVRKKLGLGKPMGIGLCFSGQTADELNQDNALEEFQQNLAENGLYVFTVNAFSYGKFHGRSVKERVYQPDWTHSERLRYTDSAARILGELLPEGTFGSISTVPCGFKKTVRSQQSISRCALNLVDHAAGLIRMERETGKRIALGLEPEPCCAIETFSEAISFFKEYIFSHWAKARIGSFCGLSEIESERLLRRHLGICYDICHAAVEFENPLQGLDELRKAGISVPKIQLSAAIRCEDVCMDLVDELLQFDHKTHLHQTFELNESVLTRYTDLPDAISALKNGKAGGEWRIHCHIPLFASGSIGSTRDVTASVLQHCRERPAAPHLEIETTAWSVLPEWVKGTDMTEDIAREMRWVQEKLGVDPGFGG
ncbi:MAG: metabolite traffic protein EboE [Desulfovibrionales bacterium]